MEFFKIIVGFLLLIFGSNILVEGVTKLAKRSKISTMIISMTIISIGTSLPELVIAFISSIEKTQITLSNSVGSVITNIVISLGITALVYPFKIKNEIKNEILKMIGVQIILLIFFVVNGGLSIIDGICFLILFIFYLLYLINKSKKIVTKKDEEDLIKEELKYINKAEKYTKNSVFTIFIFIVLGIIFTILGGDFIVDSSVKIALEFGFSQAFVGAVIISLGTTLPEFTTSLVAAKKKEFDIITGNILGSVIANIFLIIGIASIIHPITFNYTAMFQIIVMIIFSIYMYKISSKENVFKRESITLLLLYILFVIISLKI